MAIVKVKISEDLQAIQYYLSLRMECISKKYAPPQKVKDILIAELNMLDTIISEGLLAESVEDIEYTRHNDLYIATYNTVKNNIAATSTFTSKFNERVYPNGLIHPDPSIHPTKDFESEELKLILEYIRLRCYRHFHNVNLPRNVMTALIQEAIELENTLYGFKCSTGLDPSITLKEYLTKRKDYVATSEGYCSPYNESVALRKLGLW